MCIRDRITFIPLLIIKMGKQIKTWQACVMLLCAGGFLGALAYIFTDNLSTGIIIVGITVIMIFIAPVSYTHLVINAPNFQ